MSHFKLFESASYSNAYFFFESISTALTEEAEWGCQAVGEQVAKLDGLDTNLTTSYLSVMSEGQLN